MLFGLAFQVEAMSVKLKSGNLKVLQGVTMVKMAYVYPNDLKVGKMTESAYIEKKVEELNAKTPGRGDQWLKNWKADRENHFHPKFEDLMNTVFQDEKKPLRVASTADNTKYTLVMRLTWLEPGWHAGVMAKPAFLDAEFDLVETANPKVSLAKIMVRKSPGRGVWDVGYAAEQRLAEAFAKCGKEVAHLIVKKGLK